MSTTIPFPFRAFHDPSTFDEVMNKALVSFIEDYESALRDSDKADTMDDSAYQEGWATAMFGVLAKLLPVPEDKVVAYETGTMVWEAPERPAPPASGEGWDLMELYHFTSPEAAWAIVSTGKWISAENTGFVYASTHRHGQATGYGDAAVRIMVPKACAVLDDEFPDGEKHYRVDPTAILNLGPAS